MMLKTQVVIYARAIRALIAGRHVGRFLVAISLTSWVGICSTATADPAANKDADGNARKVSFDTDEGTWLSLDTTPDGKRIVFDLLGKIYGLDMAGGKATPLFTGSAFDTQPVFSPDGKEIAFISDRSGSENLWIAEANGSNPRQLSRKTDRVFASPAWSPDGDYVYVTQFEGRYRFANSGIWVYHRLGGLGVPLDAGVNARTFQSMAPSPSSDGRFLYFSARKYNPGDLAGAYSIYRRDLRTGESLTLISAGTSRSSDAGIMQPAISRDSRFLAYAELSEGRTELRMRNLQTGEDRRLAYPIEWPMAYGADAFQGLLPRYTFTPDSKEILVASGGKIRRINVETAESRLIPFSARVDLDVGPDLRLAQKDETGPVRARVIQGPRLSPDDTRIAFSAFGKLYVVPVAGGTSKRLTSTPLAARAVTENQPSWSPDGRWITYDSWSAQGGHLWKVRSDGSGEPKRLTEIAAYYRQPIFTPDGRSIVALRSATSDQVNYVGDSGGVERPFAQDVIRIPADGGAGELVVQLANSEGAGISLDLPDSPDLGRLHFSRDGSFAFIHTRQGLLSFPANGGTVRKVVKVLTENFEDGKKIEVMDMLLSPDGKWVLLLENGQLHLMPIPKTGDPELTIDLADPSVPDRRITDIGADYFDWVDGGKSIAWSIGSTFYTVSLNSLLSDRPERASCCSEDRLHGLQITVEQPRDVPKDVLVLRGATVVTMRGDEIIENADILIRGNRIAAVGKRGSVAIPPGVKIRDVSGKVITPGFVDTHAHYYRAIGRQVIDYSGYEWPAALAYGITTSLDPQTFTNDMFVYQDLIDAGLMLGPRLYSAGPGIFSSTHLSSKEQAVGIMRRYKEHYRTNNVKSYMIGNRQQRQYMVQAAQGLGMMPITENWGTPRYALTQAIDGFATNEHASGAIDLYRDVVMLYAKIGTGYSPTTLVGGASGLPAADYFLSRQSPLQDPKLNYFTPRVFLNERLRRGTWAPTEDFIFERLAASAAKIFRAGGNVGLGSHGELQGLGYHWEMQAYTMGGFTPHEVLQVATRGSATVIGRLPEVGTIEPGKYADLIIFDKNPLQDIRNSTEFKYVMKNGRLYEADTLNEVWPGRRKYR